MSKEQETKIRRLSDTIEVMKQAFDDSIKLYTNLFGTEEEQTQAERIKTLEGFNKAYIFRIKQQKAEIEDLKDEVLAAKMAFQVLLKKGDIGI